jgi:hypothetical protein
MKAYKKLVTYVFIWHVGFISSLWSGMVHAQMQIEPMVIEVETVKGKTSGVIDITNIGTEVLQVRVYSAPFTYNLDGFKELKTSPQDLTPYLVYSPRELTIQPGQKRRVRLNMRFLPSTLPGEYRAMIFTEQVITKEITSNTPKVGIIPRIGTAVYVRHGDVTPQLTVGNAAYQNNQVVLLVNNTGKATALTNVSWSISQAGQEVAADKTQPFTVIAEGKRNIELDKRELKAGTYQLSGELTWGAEEEYKLPFSTSLIIPAGHP